MDEPGFAVGFIGGEGPDPARARALARGAALAGAADAGLLAARAAGIRPAVIVGDMDSLAQAGETARLDDYPSAAVLRSPPDKDSSDTELLLEALWERGGRHIRLIGGGGGRLDHLLAIRALFDRARHPASWHARGCDAFALDEGECIGLDAPPLVSVFPLGDGPWRAESAGLFWPLEPVVWNRGAFGLSNRGSGGKALIRAARGRFLAVLPA